MALVKCRECRETVSSKAKYCRWCGISTPGRTIFVTAIAPTLVVITVVLAATMLSRATSAPGNHSKSDEILSVAAPSEARGPANNAASDEAWKAQVADAGRSWQESYCQWAWAHDLPMFPDANTDESEIVKGVKEMTVSFRKNAQELHGHCTFSKKGRAIPTRPTVQAGPAISTTEIPDQKSVRHVSLARSPSAALQAYEAGYRKAEELDGIADAHFRCRGQDLELYLDARNAMADQVNRDPRLIGINSQMTDEDFRKFKIFAKQVRDNARAQTIKQLGC